MAKTRSGTKPDVSGTSVDGAGESGKSDDGFIHAVEPSGGQPETFDPAAAPTAGAESGSEKQKRGRKKGQTATKALAINVATLNQVLFTVHAGIAAISHCPEMALDTNESKVYAECATDVLKHYSTSATEKTMAWIQFLAVVGPMYGLRFIAISRRKKDERNSHARTAGQ